MDSEITAKEVREAIWHPAADKAPGTSGIPNRFLRAVHAEMGETFRRVFWTVDTTQGNSVKRTQ
jgi:hypothetical protein